VTQELAAAEFRIEVHYEGVDAGGRLDVRLSAPAGELLHQQTATVTERPARPVYEALMTAIAQAQRYGCRRMELELYPARLLGLLHGDGAQDLTPVERSLRHWTLFQLDNQFDDVSYCGRSERFGQAWAGLARRRRSGTA